MKFEVRPMAAAEDGRAMGWAAPAPISSRPVCSGVAEVSIYIDPARHGAAFIAAAAPALCGRDGQPRKGTAKGKRA